ncbi:hypothetical protein LY90DRAFT_701161 [Neocallimastix californiae]|uniref:LITAF domain-containing protein n=1 Tax=Neocallimastix californiae TaxID=1754190 RepID=A0A1Y2DRI8_9FUNG|nr:hypothetical protein LY90DRAFT_701161 [Neocallimastix californiae]|eukprot:ORY61898.1 hypothetical protein LY90DRAFT_701161 [Neocallimastix californiae]
MSESANNNNTSSAEEQTTASTSGTNQAVPNNVAQNLSYYIAENPNISVSTIQSPVAPQSGQQVVMQPVIQPAGQSFIGQPIMVQQPGQPIMVQQPGQPVMVQQPGQPVMVQQPGQPVMVQQPGQPVMVQQPGQPVMVQQPGQPIMMQQPGPPIIIQQSGQPLVQQPVIIQQGQPQDQTIVCESPPSYIQSQVEQTQPVQTIQIQDVKTTQKEVVYSANLFCPFCKKNVISVVAFENNILVWGICFLICIFGFLFCCIPFFINDLKDVVHYCPNCHIEIARRKKL